MQTTTPTLQIRVPYDMRHSHAEIKLRKGRFNSQTKQWILDDTEENRKFAAQFGPSSQVEVTPEERIRTVALTCTALLNGLRIGNFALMEISPRRIVIEGPRRA